MSGRWRDYVSSAGFEDDLRKNFRVGRGREVSVNRRLATGQAINVKLPQLKEKGSYDK
jgi:hypothetical protein